MGSARRNRARLTVAGPLRRGERMRRLAATAACALAIPVAALGNSDPLVGVVGEPGGAGLGAAFRVERSLYRGAGARADLVPLYLYEGEHVYLHAYRIGLKLERGEHHRFDVFLSHRFEGFPYDRVAGSIAGMAERQAGLDAGLSYEYRGRYGALYGEALHNVTEASGGSEVRLGYRHDWRAGRLTLRPYAAVSLRDAKLNDYYYGVRPDEALAGRPAYAPGAGANWQAGLYGAYALTERWRLLAGVGVTRWSKGVRDSPIVDGRAQSTLVLGLMYDFSPGEKAWPEGRPLRVRAYAGRATECDVAKVVRLVCTSTQTRDATRVQAIEVGRPFIEKLHGWPFDVVGWVGLLHHDERGVQPDLLQIDAYLKGYWYGFPWSERVKTRIALGAGVSYAHGVPLLEVRDQQKNGRNTSRLLNYLDPSIDVSVGDLLGVRSLKDAFVGLGVSHRSGIFGSSQLLGNVNGGSNYIYTYVEWGL